MVASSSEYFLFRRLSPSILLFLLPVDCYGVVLPAVRVRSWWLSSSAVTLRWPSPTQDVVQKTLYSTTKRGEVLLLGLNLRYIAAVHFCKQMSSPLSRFTLPTLDFLSCPHQVIVFSLRPNDSPLFHCFGGRKGSRRRTLPIPPRSLPYRPPSPAVRV